MDRGRRGRRGLLAEHADRRRIHELAHALVVADRQKDDPKLSRGQEEVVVECVVYTVCASLGLDTSGSSIPYMMGLEQRG